MRVMGALGVGLALLTAPLTARPAAADPVLRGKAVFVVPLESARFTIFALDDQLVERRLQGARLDDLYNGVFEVPLGDRVVRALAAGQDLRIVVNGRHPSGIDDPDFFDVRLAAELHDFDPDRQVVRLDLYSTLLSAYRRSHPELTFEPARREVHVGLGAPATTTSVCAPTMSSAYLDAPLYLTRGGALAGASGLEPGGVARINRALVRAVDGGQSLRLGRGRTTLASDAESDATEDLAVALLKGSASQVGGDATGYVLDTAFGASDDTDEELDEISQQLTVISEQLTEISEQIDALSDQLTEVEDAIIDEVDLQAYQARAAELQEEINVLCTLENQLILLAESDPAEDHTSYINTLAANIQTEVDPILRDLQTELLGSPGVEGLIDFWAQLNDDGTGYPTFFGNLYLTPAVLNLNYYVSAQVLALNLLVELGHFEGPSLGQNIVNDALQRYFVGVDAQTIQIAARKLLPDGTYPSLILASDDVIIGSRTGIMWQRGNFCSTPYPYYPPDPTAPADIDFSQDSTWVCEWGGVPVGTTNQPIPDVHPPLADFVLEGLADWRLPTQGEAQTLYSARGSQAPYAYLHEQSIFVPVDSCSACSIQNFWTADNTCQYGLPCIYNLATGLVGDATTNYFGTILPDNEAYALAIRTPAAAETYQPICDSSGAHCEVPCGPDDDPGSEICPVP